MEKELHRIELKAHVIVIYVAKYFDLFSFVSIFLSRTIRASIFFLLRLFIIVSHLGRSINLIQLGLNLRVDLSLNRQLMIHIIFSALVLSFWDVF